MVVDGFGAPVGWSGSPLLLQSQIAVCPHNYNPEIVQGRTQVEDGRSGPLLVSIQLKVRHKSDRARHGAMWWQADNNLANVLLLMQGKCI